MTAAKPDLRVADPAEPADPDGALWAAFVAALGELANPVQDSTATVRTQGGGYTYRYAGLDTVLAAVRPVLARHGLALSQSIEALPTGLVTVRTRVIHRRGAALEAGPICRSVEGGPQDMGSFVTYARRYAILALLGVSPAGEDDDGGKAQASSRSRRRSEAPDPDPRRDPGPPGASDTPDEGQGAAEPEGEGPPHPSPDRDPVATGGPYKGYRFGRIARNPAGREWLIHQAAEDGDLPKDIRELALAWAVWGEAGPDVEVST